MSRTPPEWNEPNHDKPIPQRVRQRVANRANNRCENCGVRVTRNGEIDHILALINGGEHRESNLRLLCKPCHQKATRTAMAEKATIYRKRTKLGPLKRGEPKMKLSRKFDGTVTRYNPETKKRDIIVWPKGSTP